jgi:hypothetical protein
VDFRQAPFLYILGSCVALFVIAQALFFLRRAWKQGLALGLPREKLRSVVTSSILFTIAPSLAIAATVLALANALGVALPWMRLSIIGNLTYETTAAQAAMEGLGATDGLSGQVTEPAVFSAIAWVMTVGSVLPLILLPLLLKKLQSKLGGAVSGAKAAWADLMSAAAFLGLIAAFISRAIAGSGSPEKLGDGAGFVSLLTLAAAIGSMLLLELLICRKGWQWLTPFAMPASMFFAMGAAILATRLLPEGITQLEWRG